MTERSFTLLFNQVNQVIYLDCPEGRPSSVSSLDCWDDSQGEEATEEAAFGPPLLESVTTTFDVASGVSQSDPTKLNLTATTNVVIGREYIITNAYGEIERVIVERIDSGNAVYARNPLVHDYAVSDTFQSPRTQATVDSTWVADKTNLSNPLAPSPQYRAVFTYTVSQTVYHTPVYFDLVRYPYTHTVTPASVDQLSRGWLSRLALDDVRGAGTKKIEEAFRQVKLDLWERNRAAYTQRNSEFVNEMIRLKAVTMVHEDAYLQGGLNRDQLDYSNKKYWDRLDALFPVVNVQTTEDGSAATEPAAPIYRR